jgi:hypothetical protein
MSHDRELEQVRKMDQLLAAARASNDPVDWRAYYVAMADKSLGVISADGPDLRKIGRAA